LLTTPIGLSDRRQYYEGMGPMDAEGMDMGGVPVCADIVGAMDASVPHPDNSYVVLPILSWTLNFTGTGTSCDTQ